MDAGQLIWAAVVLLFCAWVVWRTGRAARKPPIPRAQKVKARSHWGFAIGPFIWWS